MKQKSSQKLNSIKMHQLQFVAILAVFPFESDLSFVNALDTAIGYGDPVCIASQILDDQSRVLEGLFAKDDPFHGIELIDQGIETLVCLWRILFCVKFQLFPLKRLPQKGKELPLEFAGKHFDGDEKILFGRNPVSSGRETSARNNAV